MDKDTQSRKWQLTINNPFEKKMEHDNIKELLGDLKSLVYWCMCDEVGENGTYHTHLYVAFSSAVRFSTLQNKFYGAHFEMANGTSQQNRDYIRKEGKWEKDRKKETNLADTFEEYGDMPVERQGARNDLHDLYDMIKSGMSNFDILEMEPNYMMQLDKIERVRQSLREEKYKTEWRTLSVIYVFGEKGVGKTRGIMEGFGYENVYRVTDNGHGWDEYKGQNVVVFEEFRSDYKIRDMLNYLDGYPLNLPCRYQNKVACYTVVFFDTNLPLEMQYPEIQKEFPETWSAFLRRITKVAEVKKDRTDLYTVGQYYAREPEFVHLTKYNQEELPFVI